MTVESVGLFVALIAVASIVVLVSGGLGVPDEVGLLLVGLGAAVFLPSQTCCERSSLASSSSRSWYRAPPCRSWSAARSAPQRTKSAASGRS
jgi:hypothetical protein